MQLRAIIIFTIFAHAYCELLQISCKEIREFVNGHNQRRLDVARGEVPGQPGASKMSQMVWDKELAEKAAGWASKFRHVHNPDENIGSGRFSPGENLYWFSTTDADYTFSVSQALDAWFNEHKNYTFGPYEPRLPGSPKIGHYTQIVWADTTYVGCAISQWKDGIWTKYFVVCNYGPSGNYKSEFPYESSGQGSQNLICTVGEDECTERPFGDNCPR